MNNTLIDNSCKELSMVNTLQKCLADHEITEVKIATGYWDLPAMSLIYNELQNFLQRENTTFKLLIGTDPVIRSKQLVEKFPDDSIKKDIFALPLLSVFQRVVGLLLEYCKIENPKFEIRIFRENSEGDAKFLHSKCYIFNSENPDDYAIGIIGSSNFTKNGISSTGNDELNFLETSSYIVNWGKEKTTRKGHNSWFDERWETSEKWNFTFTEEILKQSPIGTEVLKPITPYEVYIRFLHELWGDVVDNDNIASLEKFLPSEIQKLQYQFDAVNQAYKIMKTHGGFILADVVGLGKTIVGIMVIKKFLTENITDGRSGKVLIITPPAIKKAWQETINLFDKNSTDKISNFITFITTGSIGHLIENDEDDTLDVDENIEVNDFDQDFDKEKYGFILIDESHKFRNSDTQAYQMLDKFIGDIYPTPYVALLSATPQNNSPSDLKNQIFLFQREHQNTTLDVEGGRLNSFFVDKEQRFQELKHKQDNKNMNLLMSEIRSKVLDSLLVRRTRTDVKKYYTADSENLRFPEVQPPKSLKYQMDKQLEKLFFETMEIIVPENEKEGLKYFRYRAIEFLVNEEHKKLYTKRNLTPEKTSAQLAKIMQILLVKRLESSFAAFKSSLHNLQRYTQNMLEMLEDDCVFVCPDIDVNEELNTAKNNRSKAECYNAIREKIVRKGGNNREFRRNDFSIIYIENLKKDKKIIDELCIRWDKTTYDPKLRIFIKSLDNELFNSEINNPHKYDHQKLVIFTEAIDTVNELKREIEGDGTHRVLAITAANRTEKQEIIKQNFDANADIQLNDFDILITTEVLAEGVNLHRSNVILNYDTPWNSTRLMQRIGRVNRIGSKEDKIHVFNFMPTDQSNREIKLVEKAHAKLQAFHALFGEDSKIFSDQEEVFNFGKNPVEFQKMIDGDESLYQKYIDELRKFKNNYSTEYQRIIKMPLPVSAAKKAEKAETFCVVENGEQKLYFAVCQENAKNISTLEMLNNLQCTMETPAETLPENIENAYKRAINEFIAFFDRIFTANAGNKKRTTAIGIINELSKKATDTESRQLLNIANTMARNGNMSLINKMIALNRTMEENALFDVCETEFNELINRELSALKSQYKKTKKPEPQITLSIINH